MIDRRRSAKRWLCCCNVWLSYVGSGDFTLHAERVSRLREIHAALRCASWRVASKGAQLCNSARGGSCRHYIPHVSFFIVVISKVHAIHSISDVVSVVITTGCVMYGRNCYVLHTYIDTNREIKRESPRRSRALGREYLTIIWTSREITKRGLKSGCRSLYRSRSASDRCPAFCRRNGALPAAASCVGGSTFHNTTQAQFSPESSRIVRSCKLNFRNFRDSRFPREKFARRNVRGRW